MIDYFQVGEIELPGPDGKTTYTMKELGVSFPVLAKPVLMEPNFKIVNPDFARVAKGAGPAAGDSGDSFGGQPSTVITTIKDVNGKDVPSHFPAPKCSFVVEFAWQEKTIPERTWWRSQPNFDPQIIPPPRPAATQK